MSVLLGCLGDDVRCPDPLVAVGDRCVPVACTACGPEAPFCDVDAAACAPCLVDADCSAGPRPFCSGRPRACVACRDGDDCGDDAFCVGGACVGCAADADCAARDPRAPYCLAGGCVACRPGVEVAACSGFSCDGERGTCTETPLGSVPPCGPCRSDGECAVAGERCVPVRLRGDALGAVCLGPVVAGACAPPLVPTDDRPSLSGATPAAYCGPDEARTTCRALLDVGARCERDEDCGRDDTEDGLCDPDRARCTVPCGGDARCPEATPACVGGRCAG